jgi:hypothetical protein
MIAYEVEIQMAAIERSAAKAREMHLRDELRMAQSGRAAAESRMDRAFRIIYELRAGIDGAEARADLFIGANE